MGAKGTGAGKGKAQTGAQKPVEPQQPKKLSRAEASALRKAEHARLVAEKEAARKAALNPPIESLVSPAADHVADAGKMTDEPPLPPPSGPSPAHAHARTHAHAREGDILGEEEFAGLMDEPVPEETAATARYALVMHTPTAQTEAEVMALRYAGQDDEEIALYLKISIATLYHHYRETMATAHATFSGKLAIRMATFGLKGDFKAARFLAEKRLRGFGRADQAFTTVRPNGVGPIEARFKSAAGGGDGPEALSLRNRKQMPQPGPDGRVLSTMALGVAERPLKLDEEGNVVEDEILNVEAVVKGLAGL